MKKLLLLSLALCIVLYANAQRTKSLVPKNLQYITVNSPKKFTGNEVLPIVFQESNYYTKKKLGFDQLFGESIGTTYYDLQTNSGLPNRLIKESNGNISAVWTIAIDNQGNYPTRGSGYNYYNNATNTWLTAPTARLEPVRVGWPNIAITGNNQIVSTHAANNGYLMTKPINSSVWPTTGSTFGVTHELIWPRMVANGNIVHVIGVSDTEQPYLNTGFIHGALIYFRSTNGGQTWEDERLLPNMDTTHFSEYPNYNDDYNMAIKGDTVVILVGNGLSGAFFWKTTNAGINWTYTDILNPPSRKYNVESGIPLDFNNDSEQDYVYGSDGSSCVVIDNNGIAHMFFGRMRNTSEGAGNQYSFYTDGLWYWNETMPAPQYDLFFDDVNGVPTWTAIPDTVGFIPITWVRDMNQDGEFNIPPDVPTDDMGIGTYQTSMTSQVTACVDRNNNIDIIYAGVMEGLYVSVPNTTSGSVNRCYRNLYLLHHKANTPYYDWSFSPSHQDSGRIVPDNSECVYPVMLNKPIKYVANDSAIIAFTYMVDELPGNSLQPNAGPNHSIRESTIWFKTLSVKFPDGINEINVLKSAPVVYPNPSSDKVTVSYNLNEASNVKMSIYNMVGQQIISTNQNITAGDVNVTFNIEALPQGIYFIKSDIGKQSYTNKLIKN